jgi:hypothetical protein
VEQVVSSARTRSHRLTLIALLGAVGTVGCQRNERFGIYLHDEIGEPGEGVEMHFGMSHGVATFEFSPLIPQHAIPSGFEPGSATTLTISLVHINADGGVILDFDGRREFGKTTPVLWTNRLPPKFLEPRGPERDGGGKLCRRANRIQAAVGSATNLCAKYRACP